jgi:hypothetical protein
VVDTVTVQFWQKIAGPVQTLLRNTKNFKVNSQGSTWVKVEFMNKIYTIKVEKDE